MKVCPYCAEELPDDVVTCTQCGSDVTVEPEWKREPAPVRTPSAEEIVRRSARADPTDPNHAGGPIRGMNPMAIGAFLAAIGAGIFGTAASFPAALGVLVHGGVVALGVVAMGRTRSQPARGGGYGFAVVAVVLGLVGLIGYGRELFVG